MKNTYIVIIILIIIIMLEQCGKKQVKTTVEYVKVTDTIVSTVIKKVPTKVYVERYNDSIVYVDKPTENSIEANKYVAVIKGTDAFADIKVTTTGELLGIEGVITSTDKIITKKKALSGLFLTADVPLNRNSVGPQVGLLYQIKNKIILKTGLQYNSFTKGVDVSVGIGIKL